MIHQLRKTERNEADSWAVNMKKVVTEFFCTKRGHQFAGLHFDSR